MTHTIGLYSLSVKDYRSYIYAALLVAGNIILPQICHLMPNGGFIFLPIYFFTLIAAYKYGWQVGLITAIASPLANHLLFGMPPAHVLPLLLIKSSILALTAAYAAYRFKRVGMLILAGVVLCYQLAGCTIECAMLGSVHAGFQDFRLGIPGMLLQIAGGYALLKYVLDK